jgi:hypothetical protein
VFKGGDVTAEIQLGDQSVVEGTGGLAIGKSSTSGSNYGISIGTASRAWGPHSVTIGYNSTDYIDDSATMAYATAGSVVIGHGAMSTSVDGAAICIGSNAQVSHPNGIAVGNEVTAGKLGVVLGYNAEAGENGITIGNGLVVNTPLYAAPNTVVIGNAATKSLKVGNVSVGLDISVDNAMVFDVAPRLAGTLDKTAITANNHLATKEYVDHIAGGEGYVLADEIYTGGVKTQGVQIGDGAAGAADGSVAIGLNASAAAGSGAVAIGDNVTAGAGEVHIGPTTASTIRIGGLTITIGTGTITFSANDGTTTNTFTMSTA